MPTTTSEIEDKMLFGLTLHLVLMSKEKLDIFFSILPESASPCVINLVNLILNFSKFNHNTIKSATATCQMVNLKQTNKHKKNTLEKPQQKHPDTQLCNCTNKKQCPSKDQYLTESNFLLG